MYARKLIAITIIALSLFSQEHKTKAKAAQQSPTPDQRGTEQSPLVVKTFKSPQTDEEIKREEEERNNKSENDRNTVKLTAALALIALGQLAVYAYQAHKLRQTVKAAGEQSEAMERHISEATRSADAMEKIANTIEQGNREAMRAYLTVTVGNALYQERREGQPDLKFEARPILINTGNTPARKVCIRIMADILTIPIPEEFTFPIPEAEIKDAGIVGARVNYELAGTVDHFVPDVDVPSIKEGKDKSLCVWGFITYEDIYGQPHRTKFGQWITWMPNGTVFGYYIAGQNDAD